MIKGIFPPIPTPFVDNKISIEKLKFNIQKWNSTSLSGYVVMGSNGESVYLTKKEKIDLVKNTKLFSERNKLVIAGTGSDSILDTLELTNASAENGADFALVLTPSFYQSKMNHDALIKYFSEVADKSNIPVIIYNVPKFTNVNIAPETVAELSKHENIVGIKNSSENIAHLHEIINSVPDDFSVLVGTASIIFAGLCVGAHGGIVALANVAPEQCVKIYDDYLRGDLLSAKSLQALMLEPNKAVTALFAVPGLKSAMDALGYYGGQPRSPLSEITIDQKNKLIEILKKALILK
ncbi:MAG: dihydrodipicolinate synthase family protein [Melioribacteraceae bacterium]|nr:dihydrodipicolinate synthase family protein [Melioribacteraceae bacterium]MCF8265471.1 dihydrodipicolinate synthase family protein [Melioribacteraceae bacterium]MCF8413774.1 dihydrodipicolinate synthase family protein [Melioribacteraceae bacterium]MCF8431110.1 dihydrodipicolinate synthase family protein [Melioribacteraceae bacterium]